MSEPPNLATPRLVLRAFAPSDAADVQRLAGDRSVADTTLSIPHPYPDDEAQRWIATHAAAFADGKSVHFAITLRASRQLVGAIGLVIERKWDRAELGYWIGEPSRNLGYCSEAAQEVIAYGFEQLGLNKITALHFERNPASGRVLQKSGMQREGLHPQHVKKWEIYEDVVAYGLVRADWEGQRAEIARDR
jgi:[ribosomal protein S5]-alanine N-acetyltransferase